MITVVDEPRLSGFAGFAGAVFGTLRADSVFTPGQVLDEATQLQNAVMALAQVQFNNGSADENQLAQWNAFVASWGDFWKQCNGNSPLQWLTDQWGWFFRAKDSTRDELLAFETQYAAWQAQIGASQLPTPAPESARTADNLASAVDEAGNVVTHAEDAAKKAGLNILGIIGPWLVAGGIGLGLYAFRRPIIRVVSGGAA